MTAAKSERRNYDIEFLERLAKIETHIGGIKDHLSKINGSISDYQTTKEKLNNACKEILKMDADITDKIMPSLSSIKIKVWSVAGLIGAFSAFIGVMVGKFI